MNGDPLASIAGVASVLEEVFGVDIGGDALGDLLIGVSIGDQVTIDTYSLILAMQSTTNTETGQTPQCISQSSYFHQERYGRYLEPNVFVSYVQNIIASNSYYFTVALDPSWDSKRYTYLTLFGWFDAKHAAVSYRLQSVNQNWAFDMIESFWEDIQGCASSWIAEDIYSNEVGREASRRHNIQPGVSPGQHIYNQIQVDAVSKSTAQVLLAAQNITVY